MNTDDMIKIIHNDYLNYFKDPMVKESIDWNNKELIIKTIKQNYFQIRYVSENLLDDYNFALEVVSIDSNCLYYLNKRLQNNINLLRIMKKNYCGYLGEWYNERMEVLEKLEILEFEQELDDVIPKNDIPERKITKF